MFLHKKCAEFFDIYFSNFFLFIYYIIIKTNILVATY